jgi:hypothetical protein
MKETEPPFPGIYFLWTGLTFLGAILVSAFTLFGLAWGGTGSVGFDLAAIFGNLSTVGLLIGLLTVASQRKVFVVLTLLSASFVPIVIAYLFAPVLWRPNMLSRSGGNLPLPWLAVLLIDSVEILLAGSRLRQLRTPR